MASGLKHLVTCRCILPQFKRMSDPPQHQFVVFSIINDDNTVVPKFAQCNSCGVIHKVIEINRSEIMSGREDMKSIVTINDIRVSLPSRLAEMLEANGADLSTWEAAQHAYDNKQWGNFITLTTDEEAGMRQGKYVRILGENMFRIETFTREEVIK